MFCIWGAWRSDEVSSTGPLSQALMAIQPQKVLGSCARSTRLGPGPLESQWNHLCCSGLEGTAEEKQKGGKKYKGKVVLLAEGMAAPASERRGGSLQKSRAVALERQRRSRKKNKHHGCGVLELTFSNCRVKKENKYNGKCQASGGFARSGPEPPSSLCPPLKPMELSGGCSCIHRPLAQLPQPLLSPKWSRGYPRSPTPLSSTTSPW